MFTSWNLPVRLDVLSLLIVKQQWCNQMVSAAPGIKMDYGWIERHWYHNC